MFNRNVIIGIVFMLGFCVFAPIMDGGLKEMHTYFVLLQVVWLRFVAHIAIVMPIALWKNPQALIRPKNLKFQLLRSAILLLATITYVKAIATMHIPDALSLAFIAPFVATALSPVFLGEYVGIRRWLAIIIGFLGVLVILRPGQDWQDGQDMFGEGAFYALACGFTYGILVLVTRRMSSDNDNNVDSPSVTACYTPIVGLVAMGDVIFINGDVIMPTLEALPFIMLVGCAGAFSQFCLIQSLKYSNASMIAPIMYFEIIGATAVGYFWFDYFPDNTTWLGVAIIVACGAYMSYREATMRQTTEPAH